MVARPFYNVTVPSYRAAMYEWHQFALAVISMATVGMFSYVSCEARVPEKHPLRPIRKIVDEALRRLSPQFEPSMPRMAGHRSHPRNCCARYCCRPSTRCARNSS
jgi:hypothetical protein